jgi:hypothetical protein
MDKVQIIDRSNGQLCVACSKVGYAKGFNVLAPTGKKIK